MSATLLTFEPVAHRYALRTGERIPSVTDILKATGISTDFDELRDRLGSRAEAVDRKREIGSVLHVDAHAFDDDDLDWATVHPDVEPYLRAWATFRQNTGVVPITRERMVYHPGLRYSGTLDGIFRTPKDRVVLIDIKTGDPADAGGQFQTAAYALAYRNEHGPDPEIHERWCVQLTPGCVIPYRITPYPDWQDEARWRAIVTTFYCGHAARRFA